MIGNIFDDYQHEIWRGVFEQAKLSDVNLITYCGDMITQEQCREHERSTIFSFISAHNLDALLLISGPLCTCIDKNDLLSHFHRVSTIPLISIGIEIPHIPSIIVENASGMKAIVEHLIEHHEKKNIAFIKGPTTNEEAEIRFQAYCDVLDACNIPLDNELIFQGSFSDNDGANAIKEFIDCRNITFDALVAVDDNAALGAIEELKKRGLLIPNDIAVTGFDNIERGNYATPPLTTVNQPLYDLGSNGVLTALDLIKNCPVPPIQSYPTYPIIRKSCDCSSLTMYRDIQQKEIVYHNKSFVDTIVSYICSAKSSARKYSFLQTTTHNAYLLFKGILQSGNTLSLQKYLENVFRKSQQYRVELSEWKHIFLSLIGILTKEVQNKQSLTTEELWLILTDILVDQEIQYHANKRFSILLRTEYLHRNSENILTNFNKESIYEALDESLQVLEIPSCFYVQLSFDNKEGKLYYAYDNEQKFEQQPTMEYFSVNLLLPQGTFSEKRFAFTLVPTLLDNKLHGYVMVETTCVEPMLCETLASKINAAFNSKKMIETIQNQTTQLEKKVAERTEQIKKNSVKVRAILENSPDYILNIDHSGMILYINRPFPNFIIDIIKGGHLIDYIDYEYNQSFNDALERVVQTASTVTVETKMSLTHAPEVWFRHRLSLDKENSNSVFVICTEITTEKRNEQNLRKAQQIALHNAHKAGMANIAAQTLHNVGNILNSASVSATIISQNIMGNAFNKLLKANKLIRNNIDSLEDFILKDPKGKKVLQFYLDIEKLLIQERSVALEHSERISEKMNLISLSIQPQQDMDNVSFETVDLKECIEDVLLIQGDYLQHNIIQLKKNLHSVTPICGHKIKVMYILECLLKNSVESTHKTNNPHKEISITLTSNTHCATISVLDNGVGIPRSNEKKIFNYGFTTKKGRRGFSLHDCANYMGQMGGSIKGFTPQNGEGACIEMLFPLEVEET